MPDEAFRFSTALDVRWRDLDALNHVNNAVYFSYLEQARVHYVRNLGIELRVPSGLGFILAEASCQFHLPLRLGERVTVRTRVSELGNSSFIFVYRIEGDDGRLVASGRSVQVCYDYGSEQSVPLPDEWRRAIVDYEPALEFKRDKEADQ
jgi:acyl-CoA thioester hydrolase